MPTVAKALTISTDGKYAALSLTVTRFAARLASLSSANRRSCRGSCPNERTTRTPLSDSCRYAVIAPIVSRVRRYASAEAIRNVNDPAAITGKIKNVSSASFMSSTTRITIVPTSVSDELNSVITVSVTSESSASTSLLIREISTPAGTRS